MPFIPHTPESRIARSDSKDEATTCKGVTSGGRPCRRALNTRKPNDGVLAVVSNQNADDDGAAAFFCWQHKEQAAEFVSESQSPRAAQLYPLKGRTSTETLAERLGLLDIEERQRQGKTCKKRTQLSSANKDGLPKKWQDIPGPLLAVSTSEKPGSQQVPRQRRPHPLLSFLCCAGPEDAGAGHPTPAVPQQKGRPTVHTQQQSQALPSSVRHDAKPSEQQDRRRSSSARAVLADKRTNPANRPLLPRHPTSQTESLLALIPKSLSPQTTSQLLAELVKPVTDHDEEGYIYMFWLTTTTDPSSNASDASAFLPPSPMPSPRHRRPSSTVHDSSLSAKQESSNPGSAKILLKIGRASNVQRRMNEWTRQCGYNLSLIRFYPYIPSSAQAPSTRASPASQTPQVSPRKVPHAHKVERLIHLELAEKRVKRDCETCGKEHREWFQVSGDRQGVKAVDEVIRRWVQWAETRT
ncbi:MAG: hypothetical protein LQ338_003992 [Usnochroma carphineum]|nr:MAG: hypothetical protein LQ338_003992 [Usnochroma carphineum]